MMAEPETLGATMLNLEFCDRYAYPPRIREDLIEILSVTDPYKIRSVLLYGSTASGEIGFEQSDDGLKIYSDYDLVFIARGRVDKHFRMKLESHFSGIEREYRADPFFHINFKYIDIETYRRGLNNVSIVTQDDGIVVFGEDMRHVMQEFNGKTLNPLLHNEMLIWALWKIIAYFPQELLFNTTASSPRKSGWTYALCKETLVILMWLLPLEDVFLSSYRKRMEFIKAHYSELRARAFFGENLLRLLEQCYAKKTGNDIEGDPYDLYREISDCFLSARKYLLTLKGLQRNERFSDTRGVFFIDNTALRVLYDLYLVVRKTDPMNMRKAVQWSIASKYGLMFDILLEMNMALSFYLSGRVHESHAHLNMARHLFKKLALKDPSAENAGPRSFPECWIFLRAAFSGFVNAYVPSLRSFNDKLLGNAFQNG